MADRYIEELLVSHVGSRIGNDNLGTILLLVTVIVMGIWYSIVRIVMSQSDLGGLTYFGLRFMISSCLLTVIHFITSSWHPLEGLGKTPVQYWLDLAFWGSLVGITLFGYIICAMYGEITQTAAQASFIIAMYVVIIPIAEWILSNFTLQLSWRSWLAVTLEIPGVILISGCAQGGCFSDDFQWGLLLLVASMVCLVAYYIILSRAVPIIGVMPSIYTSFGFCAVVGTIAALIFETSEWQYPYSAINNNIGLIIATSLLEVLCTMTSTVALSFTSTTRVAIVTSLESLSGAVFGYLIIGESLVGLEYLGGGLMLSAVLVELVPCSGESKDTDNEGGVALSESELSECELPSPSESSPLLARRDTSSGVAAVTDNDHRASITV